jgi:hypothetical protein
LEGIPRAALRWKFGSQFETEADVGRYLQLLDSTEDSNVAAVPVCDKSDTSVGSPTADRLRSLLSLLSHPSDSALEADVLSPSKWFEQSAPALNEPGYEVSSFGRRGRVEVRDGVFLHFCEVCGAWGAFGYGVRLRAGHLGRWYCAEHRPGRIRGD